MESSNNCVSSTADDGKPSCNVRHVCTVEIVLKHTHIVTNKVAKKEKWSHHVSSTHLNHARKRAPIFLFCNLRQIAT